MKPDIVSITVALPVEQVPEFQRTAASVLEAALKGSFGPSTAPPAAAPSASGLWTAIQLYDQYIRRGGSAAAFMNLLTTSPGEWFTTVDISKATGLSLSQVRAVPKGIGRSVKKNPRVPNVFPFDARWGPAQAEYSMTVEQAEVWNAALAITK